MIEITSRTSISLKEISFQFSKSSGPGGQKVNKTNSRVTLIWDFENSSSISSTQKALLTKKLSRRISGEGQLLIHSERYRDRNKNIADCVEKFRNLLATSFFIPKKRKPTKPTKNSKKKRLDAKTRRGETKQNRKKVQF